MGYLTPRFGAGSLAENIHGLPGPTMGARERTADGFVRQERPARAAQTGSASRLQWHPLGVPNRRSLVGSACALPAVPDLSRYFQAWCKVGIWDKVLHQPAMDLLDRGEIDITECFIDGTFASAKKGGVILDRPRRVKASRSWRSQTCLPAGYRHTDLRSQHPRSEIGRTHDRRRIREAERVISDKAYDSDKLDGRLRKKGVRMIV